MYLCVFSWVDFFEAFLKDIVQLSHPYMTSGKTIALTRWTFVGKVMSLLLNMLSVNKAEIDVFLEFSCFDDAADVGNLISGSSAFSKTSLIS